MSKMNTAALDTSVVVRVIMGDDVRKRVQAARLIGDSGVTFVLFDAALIETVFVLETVYELSRAEVVDRLNLFLTHYAGKVEYNRALTEAALPFYLAHPKLSFADCALAALAELEQAEPLFTFDKKLANQSPSAKLVG